jgi:type VI secretion system secreted protein Hcp
MTIEGASQGKFKGESKVAGMTPEQIPVLSVSHEMKMSSGQASGKRQHGVITIVREVDAASPQLFRASASNEVLREVVLKFIGSQGSGAGAGKVAETIVLNDATINAIRRTGTRESISIVYDTINVTYVGGSKSATDDWLAAQ